MKTIIGVIFEQLENQRKRLLAEAKNKIDFLDVNIFNEQEIHDYFESWVFLEEDILEEILDDFCEIEDVKHINVFRDYQNETIDLSTQNVMTRRKLSLQEIK